ncbi:MAG: EAL domain-containing protein [Planctomycetaceae bacterium]
MTTSSDKQTTIRAIIAVADGLGLDVVAEGIKTVAQLEMLSSTGREFAQGFLFSRPLPPHELHAFVMEGLAGDRLALAR